MPQPPRLPHIKRFAVSLILLSAGIAPAQQVKVRHHTAQPTQARLRFVPEILTTVAGGGRRYTDGAPATSINLNSSLFGLAFNSQGDFYFATQYPAAVYKVKASDNTITLVMGQASSGGGIGGGPGGLSGGARFGSGLKAADIPTTASNVTLVGPKAVAVNAADELIVADTDNYVVYKVDAQNLVTIIAGTPGRSGYSADGLQAAGGLLGSPTALAFDNDGNLIIADAGNSVLRRVNASDGTMTTIAGSEVLGSGYAGDGAAATLSQISNPAAIAFDPAGNLLFSDADNYVIRKIDKQTGIISTVAGNGIAGYAGDGGPATSAELSNPFGLAVDAAGQIFIGDTSSNVVRRVALDGTISTVAGRHDEPYNGYDGDGNPATQTNIPSPGSLAFDASGSLYILVIDAGLVVRLGPGGQLNFGPQEEGTSTTQTLTVENEGSTAATLSYAPFTVQGSGFSAASASVNGCLPNAMLQPGASCDIAVTFAPDSAADFHATLNLNDDAPDSPQVADLYGVGVLPPTDTSISISPQIAAAGDTVQLSAIVVPHSGTGPAPTGIVQFLDNNTGTLLGTATLNLSGAATLQTGSIPIGSYYVYAQYLGDAAYAPSASTGTDLEIDSRSATVQLTASTAIANPGDAITLSAQVVGVGSGIPTGNVLFQVDGTTVATVALQAGTAAATVSVATPGQHSLQAVYVGDSLFAQAVSNLLPLTSHGALLQFTVATATTIAGKPSDANHGGFSGDGGPATNATMHTPSGIVADHAGNIYIADEQNNVIRKVAVDGTITTVAGTPYVGSIYNTRYGGDGGPAIYAYLDNPFGLALDAANNLYIADYSNNLVRRVDSVTGIISTFAGVPYHPGHNQDTGAATSTYLNNPSALAFDAAGNLYIADTGNNVVRKVDPAGNLTTVAGRYGYYYGTNLDGQPATSQILNKPEGVAVDAAGNLYIADTYANVVRKVDAAGNMSLFAGGSSSYSPNYGDGGPATGAILKSPQHLAFDLAGNLFIAASGENAVRKVDPSGIITTVAGSQSSQAYGAHYDPAGAPATLVPLIGTSGVGVDPYGSLLVADTFNQTVWRVGPQGIAVFGPQAPGTTSASQTVTIYNAGDVPATFAPLPYSVTGDYVVTQGTTTPCDFTLPLASGVSCTINISYRPSTGATNGTVVFASSAIGTPTINLRTNLNPPSSTTQLILSTNMPAFGDSLLLYGEVSSNSSGPTPTGTVSFFDASTLLGQAPLTSGTGYIYYSGLGIGDHTLTAVYAGDAYNAPSTSAPTTVSVDSPTQTALSVSRSSVATGTGVTLTATVTSGGAALGSGNVTFFDGGTALGTVNVNGSGVALLATPGLSSGSHSFTAVYNAQGPYGSSTSPVITVTASSGGGGSGQGLDYVLSLGGATPLVLHRGQTKQVLVSAEQLGPNYQGNVTLSCGTLPAYVTCSFSPATLIIGGPVQVLDSVLTITAAP